MADALPPDPLTGPHVDVPVDLGVVDPSGVLPDGFNVAVLSDGVLSQLVASAVAEQHARALAAGDVEAVVADAFTWGFPPRGGVADPRVVGRFLVCPGLLVGRPEHHDCTFVSVDETWCWEHDLVVVDEVSRSDKAQRSVTVLAAVEEMALTQVESRSRAGRHTARRHTSWVVRDGRLVQSAVSRAPSTHRR